MGEAQGSGVQCLCMIGRVSPRLGILSACRNVTNATAERVAYHTACDVEQKQDVPGRKLGSVRGKSAMSLGLGLAGIPGLTAQLPGALGSPFDLIKKDLSELTSGLKLLIDSDHPVLKTVAKYLFESKGKHVRPSMVLLMAHATSVENGSSEEVNAKQRRLAEITEMIHTASLLHDDVLDLAETRRGIPTAHVNFGNKVAVLAGDFLLARSSLALAKLRDVEVIEMLSTVIEHLVKGEIMQMKDSREAMASMDHYMKKTFYKTGSLVANSCKASAVLGVSSSEVAEVAYEYGRHVGLAFQLVDDALDLAGDAQKLGKAAQVDLAQGVVTAPLLFCLQEHEELEPLMRRRFSEVGDCERAYELMNQSGALVQTQELARSHGLQAIESIGKLQSSSGQESLVALVHEILTRS